MLKLRNRFLFYFSHLGRSFYNAGSTESRITKQFNQFPVLGQMVQFPFYPSKGKIMEDLPLKNIPIENPRDSLINEIREILRNGGIIKSPPSNKIEGEIHMARLIVIRRRKMKKHKLKKLRKKMKFEWAKVRQRREMKKEKAFQAQLMFQIKETEKFSAEQYVISKLQQANETLIPRFWRGKRLPQFIIKQKLDIK